MLELRSEKLRAEAEVAKGVGGLGRAEDRALEPFAESMNENPDGYVS